MGKVLCTISNAMKLKKNLAATLTALCMVGMTFSIAELCCVSVEIVNKRTRFSFTIVGMCLWNNINYVFYSAMREKSSLKEDYLVTD